MNILSKRFLPIFLMAINAGCASLNCASDDEYCKAKYINTSYALREIGRSMQESSNSSSGYSNSSPVYCTSNTYGYSTYTTCR